MIVASDLSDLPTFDHPISATVGNFDGLHLGHQQLLQSLDGTKVAITFRTHPATILRPDSPACLLCTLDHKLDLLERYGVDATCLLDFTPELAALLPEVFIDTIRRHLPFDHLALGYDGRIGCDRSGTPERLAAIALERGFSVHYIPALTFDDEPISSRRIRQAIREAKLDEAARLLGRPISYYATIHAGAGMGRHIGYPTANLDISNLCAPPFGVYAVSLRHGDHTFRGVANYGCAPTLHANRPPLFEVFLFSFSGELYDASVELTLHAFIRPERHFASADDLKEQIARDIEAAKLVS